MIDYIVYSHAIGLLYIFCGLGLTYLIYLKDLEKYTLFSHHLVD